MAFIVINVVKATKEEIPALLTNVTGLGLGALRDQPGFHFLRLLASEQQDEVKLIMEWESRDAFVAYRQSDFGRQMVKGALELHPQIEFYEVVLAHG